MLTGEQYSLLSVFNANAPRLQAVPFWIVEIAEREKTGANERRGAWGKA